MWSFLFSFIILLILSGRSFPMELPPLHIPVEVINIKQEKREVKTAPTEIQPFKINIQSDIRSRIPLVIEGIDSLLFLSIEKPKSYLGIPPSNALISRGIDNFNAGNYIFAKADLQEFTTKYKDSPYLYYAYYLLGYIEFKNSNLELSSEYMGKSCQLRPTKEACSSLAIVNLLMGKYRETKEALRSIDTKDEDVRFLEEVVFLLEKGDFGRSISADCGKLDISLSGYCVYLKKYTSFFRGDYEKVLKYNPKTQNQSIQRESVILDGFANYFLKKNREAYERFNHYLEKISVSDNFSNLALYGKALSDQTQMTAVAQILQSRDQELSQELFLRKGESLIKSRDFLNGFLHLQTALSLSERYKEEILLNIGVCMYNLGNYRYSMGIFRELSSKKKDPSLYLYSGYTAYALKDLYEAEKFFSRLTEDKNYALEALEYLSEIYLQLRDDESFVETGLKLRDLNPDKAYNLLGWYFFQKGDYKNAFKSFRDRYMKAVSAYNSNDLKAAKEIVQGVNQDKFLMLKAYIHMKENQPEKAREVLKLLITKGEGISEEASYLYAYTYFSEGKFDLAILEFKNFLNRYHYKDDEMTRKAFLRVADSYYNLGEVEIARNLYGEFISKYSNTQDAVNAAYNLLVLESREGISDVKTSLESFIKKYPDYPMIPLLKIQLAQVYHQQGNYPEAERIYREVISTNTPEAEMALYQLARMFIKTGNLEGARDSCLDFIKRYPNSDNIFNVKMLLAEVYQKQGDIDRALSTYYEIQDNDQVKLTISQLLIKKGDFTKALDYLKELYSNYPENKDISLQIGKVYFNLRKTEESEKFLQDATKSENPKTAAEGYYYLGLLYKDKDINRSLNNFLNSIYINPEVDIINVNSRFEASGILIKADRRKDASCLLKEVLKYNDDQIRQKAEGMLKDLPKCVY